MGFSGQFKGKCNYCGKIGHKRADCREKNKDKKKPAPTGQAKKGNFIPKCYNCGEMGHKRPDCPKLAKKKENAAAYVATEGEIALVAAESEWTVVTNKKSKRILKKFGKKAPSKMKLPPPFKVESRHCYLADTSSEEDIIFDSIYQDDEEDEKYYLELEEAKEEEKIEEMLKEDDYYSVSKGSFSSDGKQDNYKRGWEYLECENGISKDNFDDFLSQNKNKMPKIENVTRIVNLNAWKPNPHRQL